MDSENLQLQTKKRRRVAERKGLQKTEAKRKKLEDASSLFDKTFKLPFGIPLSRVKKVDVSIKQTVTQDHRKNEDETIIPVDFNMEFNFMGHECNELNDLKEDTRNCLKKVQELSNMTSLFVKRFKYQNCCYSEPAIPCKKLHHLPITVTDLLEPCLIPDILDRLCTGYQKPISDKFQCLLKFNLVCNIDQFLSELPLSQECEDISKAFICDYGVTQSHVHEIKPLCASDVSIDTAVDIEVPSTSLGTVDHTPDKHIKSCKSNVSSNKNSDVKTTEEMTVFSPHISPLGDKIFNYSGISDSSPVLSQKIRKDPVCSTPKIGKRTLFKIGGSPHSSRNGSKLALVNNNKDVRTGEQIKGKSTAEVHDSILKDELSFMFKLVPEEEELLFSGIGSDSADEESVTQNKKLSKSQQVSVLSCRTDTDHFLEENEMGKPGREPQKCISLSTDSADSEICKKPHKRYMDPFLKDSSPSEAESMSDRYSSVQQEGNKTVTKISHNDDKMTVNRKMKTNLTTYPKRYDNFEVSQNTLSHSIPSSGESSSFEDNFVCNKQNNMKPRNTISRKTTVIEDNKEFNANEKYKQVKTAFVDDECEVLVTSLNISKDEELESNSEYDASFLNEIPSEDSDYMVGKYLESVRSPMKGRGQFKIPEIKRHNKLDTSSDSDDFNDTYARDSFCVDDMEEPSPHSDRNESDIKQSKRYFRKGRRKVLQKSSRRWRRITHCNDSNTDETE